MKILITGQNRNQCFHPGYETLQLRIVNCHFGLVECLRDMGHEVDVKPVKFDDSVKEYDRVIVFIHSVTTHCHYGWYALDVLARRPDAIIAFDDWQVGFILHTFKQYRNELIDGDACYRKYYWYAWKGEMGAKAFDDITCRTQEYLKAVDSIQAGTRMVLVPVYKGGDTSLLLPEDWSGEIVGYNPNPYHLRRVPPRIPVKDKLLQWNFASIVHNKTRRWWMDVQAAATWPIVCYGAMRGRWKCPRLTEDEMMSVYAKDWGCLLPHYYHAGSGWWRNKVLSCMDAGSCLFAGGPDQQILFDRVYTIQDIEADPIKVAKQQREAFFRKHSMDRKVMQEQLKPIFEK